MASKAIYLHETKPDPIESAPTKISEAFGNEKCPKLIIQCKSENSEIRQKALAVLCDELKNPLSIVACFKGPKAEELKSITTLSNSLGRNDLLSRVRAAEAFFEASKDGNGVSALLTEPESSILFRALIKACRDESIDVKYFVFNCLSFISNTPDGSRAIVKFSGVHEFLR